MKDGKVTVAIAGLGSRGMGYAYNTTLVEGRFKIVAGADLIEKKRKMFAEEYNIPDDMVFNSAEEMLERERLADIMFICTLDRQHYHLAIAALNKGYHLLLEKPASPVLSECLEIARLAEEKDLNVSICHVLRYNTFYKKIKEIIDSGILGKIMCIQANEAVTYWHMAHSFVRGNWRNDEQSPILLQKSCHDMDIILWLTGKHCISTSSFGFLSHFRPEEAPEGATERCNEGCPHYFHCPYSVKHCYLDKADRGIFGWPRNVVEPEPDAQKLREALRTGPYGRCVYHCDNTVCDHQIVNLLLEDEITVTFNLCAFTEPTGREIRVMGTKGEVAGFCDEKKLRVSQFGEKGTQYLQLVQETDEFGHGGGDYHIIKDLADLISGKDIKALTPISDSIESHIVCLAAEESRLNEGKLVNIKDFIKGI